MRRCWARIPTLFFAQARGFAERPLRRTAVRVDGPAAVPTARVSEEAALDAVFDEYDDISDDAVAAQVRALPSPPPAPPCDIDPSVPLSVADCPYAPSFPVSSTAVALEDFLPAVCPVPSDEVIAGWSLPDGPAPTGTEQPVLRLPPLRRALTRLLRAFRDCPTEAAASAGYEALAAASAPSELGDDVDFACLVLNACTAFGVAVPHPALPPLGLLDYISETLATQLTTPAQAAAIAAFAHTLLSVHAGDQDLAQRGRTLLQAAAPQMADLLAEADADGLVLITVIATRHGIATGALCDTAVERAVMLSAGLAFRHTAQLLLAIAATPYRSAAMAEATLQDLTPRLLATLPTATAAECAAVLYAATQLGGCDPALAAAVLERLQALPAALSANTTCMALAALPPLPASALRGAVATSLVASLPQLDLTALRGAAALDAALAMAELGLPGDVAYAMLTDCVTADSVAVLASPVAKSKLLRLTRTLSDVDRD